MMEVFNNMPFEEIAQIFKERADKMFDGCGVEVRFQAFKCFYDNYKLDERTQLIQGYKQQNINQIHNK